MQAIITGASVGIGRAVCKAYAAAGASVACVARREADLNTLVEEIKGQGGHAIAVVADVAAPGAAQHIVAKVESELGPVDILINNAAISRISPVVAEPEDLDIWWRVYEVNVRGPVALIRAVLPSMIDRQTGIVMSVSSNVATMALPVMTAYASSKAAISKFHESLSVELEGTGVLSFAVNPGFIRTELGKPQDAINRAAMDNWAMKAFFDSVSSGSKKTQSLEVPADTLVALAAEERCKVLNGKHVTAEKNLEEILREAEKEGGGRIGKERLYLVNIGML